MGRRMSRGLPKDDEPRVDASAALARASRQEVPVFWRIRTCSSYPSVAMTGAHGSEIP